MLHDAKPSRSGIAKDRPADVDRERFRRNYPELITGEMFDEQRGHPGRGPRDRRTQQSLSSKQEQTGDRRIPSHCRRAFVRNPFDDDGGREVGIVEDPATQQLVDRSRRRRTHEERRDRTAGLSQSSLLVPLPQPVDVRSAGLNIHGLH